MSDLSQLQEDIESFLLSIDNSGDADKCPIQQAAITRVRPRNAGEATGIETKLKRLLAGLEGRRGKIGVSLIVGMPEVGKIEPNSRKLKATVSLVIEVSENIIVNMGADGTQCEAEEFALEAAAHLQHQVFQLWSPLRVKSILPAPEAIIDKRVVYNITVETELSREAPARCDAPVAALEAGVLTLSSTTPGASVYYTLNGSYPGPGNATAFIYAMPAPLSVGDHTLRAAAWKTGLAGSLQTECLLHV